MVAAVEAVARQRGVAMAAVALAWLLAKPELAAPIVGASKPGQIDDALAAVELALTPEEIALLETPYVTRAVVGHG